jgi:Pyridoxal-phosphate dependent enzyme
MKEFDATARSGSGNPDAFRHDCCRRVMKVVPSQGWILLDRAATILELRYARRLLAGGGTINVGLVGTPSLPDVPRGRRSSSGEAPTLRTAEIGGDHVVLRKEQGFGVLLYRSRLPSGRTHQFGYPGVDLREEPLAFGDEISTVPPAGVVAASGGNRGVAVAYPASRLGLPATIFVPSISSPVKIARIRDSGAKLVVGGESYADDLMENEKLNFNFMGDIVPVASIGVKRPVSRQVQKGSEVGA